MTAQISGTIVKEGMLLLMSLLQGAILMAVYDIFRIFRKMIKHGTIWLALEDIIYWTGCSIAMFAMLYQENGGAMRWFIFAGTAIGMLVENHFISPYMVRLVVKVLRFFIKIFSRIFGVIKKPLRKIRKRGYKIIQFFKKWLKKIAKAIKIGLCKL